MASQRKVEPFRRTALLSLCVDAAVLFGLVTLAILAGEGVGFVAATVLIGAVVGAVAVELADRIDGIPNISGKALLGELVDVSNPWVAAFPWITIPGAWLIVFMSGSYVTGAVLPAMLIGSQVVPLLRGRRRRTR